MAAERQTADHLNDMSVPLSENKIFTRGLPKLLTYKTTFTFVLLCIIIYFFVNDIDIFVNCNWVVTRWQYTFTHKQYIEQYKTNNI